ncbi:MAG: amidohydrolase family protein [Planctomycetota bacterium]
MKETIYSARWVFPIDQPPIQGGFIRIVDDRIVEVNSLRNASLRVANTHDLGDVAVLPKLVNAHTHLEFSDCRQPIGDPGMSLTKWIARVIQARGRCSQSERESNVARGLEESFRAGVGYIGDIATTPTRYPESPVGVVSFAEVLGLSQDRSDERFASALAHHASLDKTASVRFAVSPHAPYSTPTPLVERCVDLAVKQDVPIAMHLAETPEERQLLETGGGGFADSLRNAGVWRDGLFPHVGSQPIRAIIRQLSAAPRVLLIHGNDLQTSEIEELAGFPKMSVVFCPRTHAFFQHPPHPVADLLRAGVSVALGTDSRASNPDLSVWREVQFLLQRRGDLEPADVLKMATASGGDALYGRQLAVERNIGRIGPGPGGIDSFGVVPTMADRLDDVWRDFAANELLCINIASRP